MFNWEEYIVFFVFEYIEYKNLFRLVVYMVENLCAV